MAVVHIGWNTLDKRVREFTSTTASTLTIDEFEEQAKAHEEQVRGGCGVVWAVGVGCRWGVGGGGEVAALGHGGGLGSITRARLGGG
jgi:hypothetical protein